MMTPPDRHVTGGVDTHGEVHVVAALDSATGRHLGTASFPTTTAGYVGLLEWLRALGQLDQVGIELTGRWGRADAVSARRRRRGDRSRPPGPQGATLRGQVGLGRRGGGCSKWSLTAR
jgi:hypothetical protein